MPENDIHYLEPSNSPLTAMMGKCDHCQRPSRRVLAAPRTLLGFRLPRFFGLKVTRACALHAEPTQPSWHETDCVPTSGKTVQMVQIFQKKHRPDDTVRG
jgi:hypothetical protein